MSEKKYNGWFNRETWLVNLWLTNDAPEIGRCPRCGAIGEDVKTNRPPMIIVNCKLDFPKYTCIKCGSNWGSLL
ncbi:MAG: DUF7249 family protein [Promethearchaeota archaeon]